MSTSSCTVIEVTPQHFDLNVSRVDDGQCGHCRRRRMFMPHRRFDHLQRGLFLLLLPLFAMLTVRMRVNPIMITFPLTPIPLVRCQLHSISISVSIPIPTATMRVHITLSFPLPLPFSFSFLMITDIARRMSRCRHSIDLDLNPAP